MRRGALRSALSVKAGNGDVIVVDEIVLTSPKTKEMLALVRNVAGSGQRHNCAHG